MSPARSDPWSDLVATALVGTARRQFTGSQPSRPQATGEVVVLDAAALAQAERTAGLIPPHDTSLAEVAVAPADRLTDPPERATQLLELLLFQNPAGHQFRNALVTQWCRTAETHRRHIPHRLLPATLTMAAKAPTDVVMAVRAVMDERGRWLADRVPDYARVAGDLGSSDEIPDPTSWSQVPTLQRVATVKRVRERDPAAGMALVQSTWDQEPAKDRAALLAALEVGLSMADEPFLEASLDERGASVKQAAADLLDGLPDSRRATRMAERLTPLLRVSAPKGATKGLVDRLLSRTPHGVVDVDYPDDPDKAAIRDGLLNKAMTGSKREFWLTTIVRGAPLATWDAVGGADAAATITSTPVKGALAAAAVAQRDPEWARALVNEVRAPELLPLLTPDERDAWAIKHLSGPKPTLAPDLLAALPGPWSQELSTKVISILPSIRYLSPETITAIAVAMHPGAAPQLSALAAKAESKSDATQYSHAVSYQSVRQSIQEAFS